MSAQLEIHHRGVKLFAVAIDKDRMTIGRAETCDVVVQGPNIRRLHAVVEYAPEVEGFTLTDLGLGETYLNGERVRNSQLFVGDEICIGDYAITIAEGSPAPLAAGEIQFEAAVEEAPPARPTSSIVPGATIAQPDVADLVLVTNDRDELVAAPLARVLWAATADEMTAEPTTGELFIDPLDPFGEPIFLLERRKSFSASPARASATRVRGS